MERTFGGHLWLAIIPFGHLGLKKSWNGCNDSTIKDRDLQWKLNTPKFGSIFNLNMLLAILMAAITRIHKMATMALLLKVETCNENWTLLGVAVWTCCCPFMIRAIIKNYKNCYHSSSIKDRNLQQREHLYVWNIFDRMHVYSVLGLKFIQTSYAILLKPIRENDCM